jgi:hypothetical protein
MFRHYISVGAFCEEFGITKNNMYLSMHNKRNGKSLGVSKYVVKLGGEYLVDKKLYLEDLEAVKEAKDVAQILYYPFAELCDNNESKMARILASVTGRRSSTWSTILGNDLFALNGKQSYNIPDTITEFILVAASMLVIGVKRKLIKKEDWIDACDLSKVWRTQRIEETI